MRLYLRDSERRPDPVPVATDDRRAMLIGLAAWVVALVAVLVFFSPVLDPARSWLFHTCTVGILLGLAGLIYTARRSR